ncbi:MAG: hypothetical protein ABDK92_07995 [Atribacterota bacterium]
MAEKLRRAKEIVEIIGVVYNLYQLSDALSRLEGAGNLRTERLNFTFRTQPG